ncbi:hypothetical protein AC579_4992 [Pseudocercospora musae]|uniref:Uncharacterized protein n=1 Tax=Pseudocercospora musae TaxID=113226 RepID=A0A139IG17_9PEZI|nr:hypothetical protein AC579_4992 [Pseudocercospora musae]
MCSLFAAPIGAGQMTAESQAQTQLVDIGGAGTRDVVLRVCMSSYSSRIKAKAYGRIVLDQLKEGMLKIISVQKGNIVMHYVRDIHPDLIEAEALDLVVP